MFIGMQFCGDDWGISSTATNTDNIQKIQVTNGIYGDFFGTTNVNIIHSNASLLWDFYTKFYAKFQDSLVAGNVNYSAKTVSTIRIKRRKVDDHKWFTLFDIPISSNDSFDFELVDRYAQGNQEYVYALIPVIDNVEGNINSNTLLSKFNSYFILDKEVSYPIILNTSLNLTINKESGVISTLGRKYPFYISNGISNYKTGTLKFGLVPFVNCEINVDLGYAYRQSFEEWINNGNPKILKDWTGQMFMINITDVIPVSFDTYEMPEYQISFTEIGDCFNEDDMYLNGFSDVNRLLQSS